MITSLPKLIAHRGASAYLPENTLAAFHLAKTMGAEMFECDVQLSKDHIPIIFHDDILERTTEGRGCVYDFSFKECRALPIRNSFKTEAPITPTLQIPSLEETFDFCLAHKMKCNLELKVNSLAPKTPLLDEVIKTIQKYPRELAEWVLVSSFDWDRLRAFHQAQPQFSTALLIDKTALSHAGLQGIQHTAQELKALSLHIEEHLILHDPRMVESLKPYTSFILSYTINDIKTAHRLFEQGVDGVFSDNPQLLV